MGIGIELRISDADISLCQDAGIGDRENQIAIAELLQLIQGMRLVSDFPKALIYGGKRLAEVIKPIIGLSLIKQINRDIYPVNIWEGEKLR